MNLSLKISVSVLLVLLLAIAWTSTVAYRSSKIYQHDLPMTFAHQDHAEQQCVGCHHNYIDRTGQGLCLICHQTDPEISYLMRDQFHDLCMDCHQKNRQEGEKAGPLRRCIGCHQADDKP